MKQGLRFDRGRIACVEGKGLTQVARTVINGEQVEAIRMVVRDEIERMATEDDDLIDESHEAGFYPYNGI